MTLSPTDLTLDALAVARIVRLIQVDEIPIGKARELILDVYSDRTWADLLTCGWCLSMWVAGAVAFARWRYPRAWPIAARILAGSQAAGLLAEMTG